MSGTSFHPEALAEMIEAARYYEAEAPGLGLLLMRKRLARS